MINKVIVFDLDGTIFDGNLIQNEVRNFILSINQQTSIVISSARKRKDIINILEKSNIPIKNINYIISEDGYYLYNVLKDTILICGEVMTFNKNVVNYLSRFSKSKTIIFTLNHTYLKPSNLISRFYYWFKIKVLSLNIRLIKSEDIMHLRDVKKIKIKYRKQNSDRHNKLASALSDINIFTVEDKFYQLQSLKTDKFHALKEIQRSLNIPSKNIIVCGNDGNDYLSIYNYENSIIVGDMIVVHNRHIVPFKSPKLVFYLEKFLKEEHNETKYRS